MAGPRSFLAALGLAAVVVSGCGQSAARHDSVGMTPMQAVLGAPTATEKASTAKTSLTVEMSLGGEKVSLTGDGAFDFVNSVGSMRMSISNVRDAAGAIDLVMTDSTLYLKSDSFARLTGKPWLSVAAGAAGGAFAQFGSSDPSQGLAFLQGVKQAKLEGHQDIRGVRCSRYSTTVDLTAAANGTTLNRGGWEKLIEEPQALPIDVWLDDQNRVMRILMTLRTKADESTSRKAATTKVTTEFYDFGTPVKVTIPPASDVADGSRLLGGSRR